MTDFVSSLLDYRRLLIVIGIIAAAVLGFYITDLGWNALAWPLVPILVLLVFYRPIIGVYVFVATIPLEGVVVFENISFTRVLGIIVFSAWIMKKVFQRESLPKALSRPFFLAAFSMGFLALISIAWAYYPNDVFVPLLTLIQLVLLALLVTDVVPDWPTAERIAKSLLLAALVAAFLTFYQYMIGDVSVSGRAGSGVTGGLNSTAMVLVTIIPFALYMIRTSSDRRWRNFSILYIVLALLAVLVTFSRTSYILLALLILFEYGSGATGGRVRAVLVLLLGAVVVGSYLFIPQDVLNERFGSILEETVAVSDVLSGQEGVENNRGFYLRVALEIFRDHPILGAGYDNFRRLVLVYQYEISGAELEFSNRRSPHNSYTGMLANLGLIGFLLWLTILFFVLQDLRKAQKKASQKLHEGNRPRNFIRAVTQAFFLQVGYGFARPVDNEKLLWVILGLAIVVSMLAVRDKN